LATINLKRKICPLLIINFRKVLFLFLSIKPQIKLGHTTRKSKDKGPKDKQSSTKHYTEN